jgi:hypothetical protein
LGPCSLHGSQYTLDPNELYEYFQNEALNARPYAFSGPTTKFFRYNNFGGSVGGPILHDKLFFYFNYDRIIQNGIYWPVKLNDPASVFPQFVELFW